MSKDRASRGMWLFLGVLFGLFFFSPTALAQTGSITGVVVDEESGETLIGANVVLDGTTIGSTTDIDGRYEITGVVPGTYNVVFSYIGYDTKTVQGVEVQPDAATELSLSLTEEAIGLGEIVVEAEAVRNAEAALLRERQKAAAMSDAISAEAISRSGSSTASDAMRKVTGVSVVGGRYVYVRGLGDRYMTTQLNGATLPSADPDRNAVPFDLFSADILDNIVTVKTFTPDKPGSFAGGVINIGTKTFPESFRFSLSSSVGYDKEVNGNDAFLTYPGGAADREIPVIWLQRGVSAGPIQDVAARTDPVLADSLHGLSRAFGSRMAPTTSAAPVSRSVALSTGNQVHFLKRPLGFIVSLSYDHDYSFYSGGTTAEYKLTDIVSRKEELDPQFVLNDARGTDEVLLGGLATVSYKLLPTQILSATLVYNRTAESLARYQVGSLNRDFAGRHFETRALGYTERELRTLQVSGDHFIEPLNGLRFDWNASWMASTQDEPDLRFFANDYRIRERDGQIDTLYAITTANYDQPSRYFRAMEEHGLDLQGNLSMPFSGIYGLGGTLKAGGAFNTRDRVFRERYFVYALNPATAPYEGDPAIFFAKTIGVIDTTTVDGSPQYVIGNYVRNQTTPGNNYDGTQQVYAGYGMVDLRVLPQLRIITGTRFEASRIDVASLDPKKQIDVDPATGDTIRLGSLSANDWLPSVNAVYQIGENMNVRAAYGRTLAQPVFRELAPYASFDFIGGRILIGNPRLERTLVDNLDLRWEWFSRPGEIVAVSGFYKRLQNPIELAIVSTNNEVQYQNVEQGMVYGAEFEVRKRLDNVWAPLGAFSVGGNLTLAHSAVDIPEAEMADILALVPGASDQRPLAGQSSYVVNLDVTYANPGSGTVASVLYNVFGERLAEVAIGGTPDVYEQPAPILDLIVSQPLLAGFCLKVSAKNLLNSAVRRTQAYKGEDFVVQRYDRGHTFSVGISYAIE